MGVKQKPESVTSPGRLVQELLEGIWRAAHEENADVVPPIPELDIVVQGSSIQVATEEWCEVGDLRASQTFTERLWRRLGWSMFRDCRGSFPVAGSQRPFFAEVASHLEKQSRPWPEDQRCVMLGFLAELGLEDNEEICARLNTISSEVRNAVLADGDFIGAMFAGRKSASSTVLLRQLESMVDDPRPLQRYMVVKETADHVAGAYVNNPLLGWKRARTVLEKALADEEPCVKEEALMLNEILGVACFYEGAYEASIPYLDRAVERGPNFALQHLRRWLVQLCLGEVEAAANDWTAFQTYHNKMCDFTDDAELQQEARLVRLDGLVAAAFATRAKRDGWPTIKSKRKRAKKPRPVPNPDHFHSLCESYVEEALALTASLPPNIDSDFPLRLKKVHLENRRDLKQLPKELRELVQ